METNFDFLWEEITRNLSLPEHSIHGPDHWRRVERNGILVARSNGGNIQIVRLFALFHDSRRIKDDMDPGHGARGATYAQELRGVHYELSDADFDLLHYACTWHTDKLHHPNPTIAACWDADRLDLGRVGIVPDPSFLNTPLAKKIARSRAADGDIHSRVQDGSSPSFAG